MKTLEGSSITAKLPDTALTHCTKRTVETTANGLGVFAVVTLLASLVLTPLVSLAASNMGAIATPSAIDETQRVRQVLSRLTYGARPGDAERVAKMGVREFVRQQLDPYSLDDAAVEKRLAKLPTLNLSTPVLALQYNPTPTPTPPPAVTVPPIGTVAASAVEMSSVKPDAAAGITQSAQAPTPTPSPAAKPTPVPKNANMVIGELRQAKLLRGVYSERQLYEMTVEFWENHFSIFGNKDANRWMMTSFDRDAVRPFAFGRFRDLLGAVAKSPAMLYYLDNWQSSVLKEYPATKDKPASTSGGINENYARELLELHTLGVDGGYTQKDVQEVARCLTGWSIRNPRAEGTFYYNPAAHDQGEKTVLGVRIPAGGGIADGERVLDILAKHPATAKFIATKLARRFLGDTPPPAAIQRASGIFLASDGSITETIKSIVTSKEFFSTTAFQSKVKTPFEYVASALRATGTETNGDNAVLDWISRMGQPVFGRLTPDGYPDTAGEWLSNNDLLTRLNFATALTMNRIKGTTVKLEKVVGTDDPGNMPDTIVAGLLNGRASPATRSSLGKLVKDMAEPSGPAAVPVSTSPGATAWASPSGKVDRNRGLAEQLIALALGSPEFQRR